MSRSAEARRERTLGQEKRRKGEMRIIEALSVLQEARGLLTAADRPLQPAALEDLRQIRRVIDNVLRDDGLRRAYSAEDAPDVEERAEEGEAGYGLAEEEWYRLRRFARALLTLGPMTVRETLDSLEEPMSRKHGDLCVKQLLGAGWARVVYEPEGTNRLGLTEGGEGFAART